MLFFRPFFSDVIKAPKAEDQDEVGSQGSKEEPLKSPSTCINFNGSDEEPEINESKFSFSLFIHHITCIIRS